MVWDTVVNKLDVQKTVGGSVARFRYEPLESYPQLEISSSSRHSFFKLEFS